MAKRKWTDRATRIESLWSLGNLVWSAAVGAGGGIMTWLSSMNDFVAAQGAFGYAVVFILSTFLLAAIFALVAYARARRTSMKDVNEVVQKGFFLPANIDAKDLPVTVKAHYQNESVEIDGKRFLNCVFDNCTFVYSGGAYMLDDCYFSGSVSFKSPVPGVAAAFVLVAQLTDPYLKETEDGAGRKRFTTEIKFPSNHPAVIPGNQLPKGIVEEKKP